jgi:hypothetical protein
MVHKRNWEGNNIVYEVKDNQITIGSSENNKIFVIHSNTNDYINPNKDAEWFFWNEDLQLWQRLNTPYQIWDEDLQLWRRLNLGNHLSTKYQYPEAELVDIIFLKLTTISND